MTALSFAMGQIKLLIMIVPAIIAFVISAICLTISFIIGRTENYYESGASMDSDFRTMVKDVFWGYMTVNLLTLVYPALAILITYFLEGELADEALTGPGILNEGLGFFVIFAAVLVLLFLYKTVLQINSLKKLSECEDEDNFKRIKKSRKLSSVIPEIVLLPFYILIVLSYGSMDLLWNMLLSTVFAFFAFYFAFRIELVTSLRYYSTDLPETIHNRKL